MRSIFGLSPRVPFRHTAATVLPTLLCLSLRLYAQAPSMNTVPLPMGVGGPATFDSAGNLYSFGSGPVTTGVIQTQNGGGQCLFSNGFFDYLAPCTDAYIGKIDPN